MSYSVSMSQRPASNVTMTVSGLFLQNNVTTVFTPWDFAERHNVTVHMRENMAITGHYWMLMEHSFSGGVEPEGHDPSGRVAALLNAPQGHITPQGTFTPDQTQLAPYHELDFTCTNRSKYHCGDKRTAWSHSRPPHAHMTTEVSGWVPGRFWSPTTKVFYQLKLPILVLDNDEYEIDELLGEVGRVWKIDSTVEEGTPMWRGPFTLGSSFFSANTDRCADGEEGTERCLDGPGWDEKKKRLSTATYAWPPAPPTINDCSAEYCTSTGADSGYWTHDAQFGLQDAAFRLFGPTGSVDTIQLKKPQDKLFVFRPCYIVPPGLPDDFYELNNIDCPAESGYHLELDDGEEPPPYPNVYAGAEASGVESDPLCLWSMVYQWELNPPVRKRHLRHLYIKCIILPRQARDKHRANSKKCRFLEAGEVLSPRSLGCFRCFRLEPVLAKQSSLMMSTTCMFETQSFLFRPCTRGWRRHQSRALPSRSEVTKRSF